MKDQNNSIDSIEWHDSILRSMNIETNEITTLMLVVDIYREESSKNRGRIELKFSKIRNLTCTLDTFELEDNRNAGNISNGYIKQQNGFNKFILYFVDGILSFTFDGVSICN